MEWNDATSVYGYGGPVASHERTPEPVVRNFHAALRAALVERGVVAVFSRLHPLIAQDHSLAGLGDCCANGETVSIDLTLRRRSSGRNIAMLTTAYQQAATRRHRHLPAR